MDDILLSELNNSISSDILRLKEHLKTIRTGRASGSLVEGIIVETYGGQSKLKIQELASLSTEGPGVIVIQPFDPSTTQDIEKAILKSPLGLSPQVTGNRMLVRVPSLSEEQREKYMKLVGQSTEDTRVKIRNHRDEVRKKVRNKFEAKEISEDMKFRLEKEIDSITQKHTESIQEIRDNKEREIKEI